MPSTHLTKNLIGIIGFGNMGSALGQKISAHYPVIVFDQDPDKCPTKENIIKAHSLAELAQKSSTIIIAVKPQDFIKVIDDLVSYSPGKLFISIAAGISTEFLEAKLPSARIIRVMPNLPAQIGKGISAIAKGVSSWEEDLDLTEKLFSFVGKTLVVDESLMNAVTAIAGSGPGFYFRLAQGRDDQQRHQLLTFFIPALQEAACELGFSLQTAQILAQEAGLGAQAYLDDTGIDPVTAEKKVASKGGTTEAGLAVLKNINCLTEAAAAACKRAQELSHKS